jgi:serine/threonine protein kinase
MAETDTGYCIPAIRTEFSSFGTLRTFMSAWECPVQYKRHLISGICHGLAALHGCSIVHGDMKAENILLFPSDQGDFPFVAKISDFGFSLDTSASANEFGRLVGWTPLWAAPEAGDLLKYSEMYLTDIYSLGFVIWMVALDGQSPFETLRILPREPRLKFEAFKFLKETDEIAGAAVEQILQTRKSDDEVSELINMLHHTLRLDPHERDLDSVIGCLLTDNRRSHGYSSSQWEPLIPLNVDKVGRSWMSSAVQHGEGGLPDDDNAI